MSRLGWITAGVVAVIVLLGVVGVVNALDDTETHDFGEGEVTIETTPGASDVDQIREVVAQFADQTGMTEEVKECVLAELASIPDTELQRYVDFANELGPEEAQQRMVPMIMRINRECVPNRGAVVDENLDQNQLALVRESTINQLEILFRHENVPEPIINCVVDRVEDLSDAELIEASNETVGASKRRFIGYVRECR